MAIALLPKQLEPRFSEYGQQGFSAMVDGFDSICTVPGLPFQSWVESQFDADSLSMRNFQVMGVTSTAHTVMGPLNIKSAAERAIQAYEIGDKRGVYSNIIDGTITSGAQTAYGFDYVGYTASNIGQMATPPDSEAARPWVQLTEQTEFAGNILCSVIYGGLSLCEFYRGTESFILQGKLDQRETVDEKIAYLKRRLHADEETLFEKLGECVEERAEDAAINAHVKVLREKIAFMREHGMCTVSPDSQRLTAFVLERLDRDSLVEQGKEILVENLRLKKVTKLTRCLGSEAVQELQKDEVDFAKVEESFFKTRYGYIVRGFFYAAAAVGSALTCTITAGMPFLILMLALTLVYTIDGVASYRAAQDLHKDEAILPGRYDETWPMVGIGVSSASLATAVALTLAFTLPFPPLLLTIGLVSIWIAISCLHIKTIEKKRDKAIEKMMEKDELTLLEFAYIANYGKVSLEDAFDKLGWEDRKAMEPDLDLIPDRLGYLKAARAWILETQKISLQELSLDIQTHFSPAQ